MTNSYNKQEGDRVPLILNWLGQEGPWFIQTLNDEEQKGAEQAKDCSKY